MSYTLNNGLPTQLDGHDTAPPPLPSWLKGFLVTSKKREDVAAAGREIANLCNDLFFKLAYDDLGVPASMVKPGETEVPYDFAEPSSSRAAPEASSSRSGPTTTPSTSA